MAFNNDGSSFTGMSEAGSPFSPGSNTTSIVSGEIRTVIVSGSGNEIGVRANMGSVDYRYLKFKYRIESGATILTGHTLFHSWSVGYSSDYFQIRVDVDGAGYKMALYDPTNGTLGAWSGTLSQGTTYTVEVLNTGSGGTLTVNGVTASITSAAFSSKYIGVWSLGNFYSGSLTGTQFFDDIALDTTAPVTLPPAPTTDIGRLEDVYAGYKQRHIAASGMVKSHPAENRAVSEGQAYAMKYAVQFNDQTAFDLAEAYSYSHFDRRNYPDGGSGINTPTDSFNLMAYNLSSSTEKVLDWAAAYDADIDRAVALIWAHNRWGSAGTINYLSRATAIMNELVTYGLRQASFDGKWYMVSGTGNMSISSPELNNSYLDPAAFRLFAQYNTANSAKWLSAVSSSHDIINRTALAVLPNPASPGNTQTTTAKLPANWVTMDFTTGAVTPLTASYRDTNYTYDAFRQTNRLLYDYIAYGDATSLARLQDYKSFLANEWTTKGYIRAEYFHDGTEKEAYSNRMFYYAAWQVLTANDPSNSVGAAIYSAHLQSADMYVQSSGGSYFDTSTNNSGDSGYYGLSWLLFDEMQRLGYYTNFGQKAANTNAFFMFM